MNHEDQIKKLTEERDAWRTVAAALLKLVPEAEPAMREAGILRTVHEDVKDVTPTEQAREFTDRLQVEASQTYMKNVLEDDAKFEPAWTFMGDCPVPTYNLSYSEYVKRLANDFPDRIPMYRSLYLENVLGYDPPSERDYTVGDAVGLKRQESFQDAKKKMVDEHKSYEAEMAEVARTLDMYEKVYGFKPGRNEYEVDDRDLYSTHDKVFVTRPRR